MGAEGDRREEGSQVEVGVVSVMGTRFVGPWSEYLLVVMGPAGRLRG